MRKGAKPAPMSMTKEAIDRSIANMLQTAQEASQDAVREVHDVVKEVALEVHVVEAKRCHRSEHTTQVTVKIFIPSSVESKRRAAKLGATADAVAAHRNRVDLWCLLHAAVRGQQRLWLLICKVSRPVPATSLTGCQRRLHCKERNGLRKGCKHR